MDINLNKFIYINNDEKRFSSFMSVSYLYDIKRNNNDNFYKNYFYLGLGYDLHRANINDNNKSSLPNNIYCISRFSKNIDNISIDNYASLFENKHSNYILDKENDVFQNIENDEYLIEYKYIDLNNEHSKFVKYLDELIEKNKSHKNFIKSFNKILNHDKINIIDFIRLTNNNKKEEHLLFNIIYYILLIYYNECEEILINNKYANHTYNIIINNIEYWDNITDKSTGVISKDNHPFTLEHKYSYSNIFDKNVGQLLKIFINNITAFDEYLYIYLTRLNLQNIQNNIDKY